MALAAQCAQKDELCYRISVFCIEKGDVSLFIVCDYKANVNSAYIIAYYMLTNVNRYYLIAYDDIENACIYYLAVYYISNNVNSYHPVVYGRKNNVNIA